MHVTSGFVRRSLCAVVAPSLVLATLSGVSAPAYADPTPSGTSGIGWLSGQLNSAGLIEREQFDFTDYGLSADVAIAAVAAGDPATAQRVSAAIAGGVEEYIAGDSFGDEGSTYAGETAKILVVAQATGADATAFGGVDLIDRVESTVSDQAGRNGRIGDISQFGDNANVIGQTFAVQGLSAARSARADDATSFLISQQCAEGFFRLNFSPADAADQTCDGADSATPSTDTTAFAVLALASRGEDPRAQASIAKATAWLKGEQKADGSFGGDEFTPEANTNSTGLAAAALGAACEVVDADRGGDWVRSLQVGADAPAPLASEVGAIAYSQAALATARSEGITEFSSDQFRRASAQAILGLLWQTAGSPSVSFGLTPSFGRVGKPLTLRVRGVAAGETVCFGDVGEFRTIRGEGGVTTVKVTEEAPGKVRYRATTGPGLAAERITFLDRTRFKVTTKSRVKRGAKQAVAVRGLERGEKVRILVGGKRVAKGKANAAGRYFTRFKVTGAPGRTRVKVIGQFYNRLGFQAFRVVR